MTDFGYTSRLTPLRITGLYLAAGFLALALSDLVLPRFVSEPPLRNLQLLKGALEVVLTGALVYGLVWYSHRSLQAANRRLERNEEVLQVLLRLLRHNIRNEMNVIQGHAQTAHAETDHDEVEDSCSAILTTARKLLRHTETVNELRTMLEGTTETRTYDLRELVDDVVHEAHQNTQMPLETETDGVDPVAVVANNLLPVALGELVDNAVRHNDGGTAHVTFSTAEAGDCVELHVADDGPGIPEGELTALAEREESPLVHGSGLGLWFVHWVVTDAGGDVSITAPPEGGTTVTLSLRQPAANGSLLDDTIPTSSREPKIT